MATGNRLNNHEWIRSCFGIKNPNRVASDRRARTESGVRFKFEDTTLGGSKAINSPAAFTEYADLPVRGLTTKGNFVHGNPNWAPLMADLAQYQEVKDGIEKDISSSNGLGRTYGEVYSDTGEYVTMRFGLPKQNPLLSFLTSFYNPESATLARTGEGSSTVLKAVGAIGTVAGMALSPAFLVTRVVSFLVGRPISRFYYLDPKMPLFWQAAGIILNSLIVNAGVVPRLSGRDQSDEDLAAQWEQVKQYHAMMPDIFRANGGIDLVSVAGRYNRLAIAYHEAVTDLAIKANSWGWFIDEIRDKFANTLTGAITGKTSMDGNAYILQYLEAVEKGVEGLDAQQLESRVLMFDENAKRDEYGNVIPDEEVPGEGADAAYSKRLARWSFSETMRTHLENAINDGAEWITWRVENTGATTESFSTSTGEPAFSSGFNAMSGSARDLRFNAGQFQTGVGIIDSVASGIGSLVGTALDAVKLEGLKALLGNAFVDVPDIVTGSSAKMPDMSYTMEIRPWSNDPITRVIEMHVPIAIALAMILPISTGLQSYGLPFICEAYSRSRVVCKLGAVTSMSITRGTSNLARNADGDPLGITINWTLTDLSRIVHMPVHTDMSVWSKFTQLLGKSVDGVAGAVGLAENDRRGQAFATLLDPRTYDDSNKFTDLMAVYGGLTLQEQIYTGQKLKVKMLTSMTNFDSWWSLSRFNNRIGSDTFFGRTLSIFARGTSATN